MSDLTQRIENLLAMWILLVEKDPPDDPTVREAFAQWKISVEMAAKHLASEPAAQSLVEHTEMLLEKVQFAKSASA